MTAVAPESTWVLEAIDTVVHDVIREDAPRIDREAVWPEAGLRALQDAGLVVPAAAGGMGLGMLALTQACPSISMCYGMHCVGAAASAVNPTPEQQRDFLEPIARGEHLTTIALSEPGIGSHLWLAEAQLEQQGGEYVVRGQKTFISSIGLELNAARVPVGNLLGREGVQVWYLFNVIAPYCLMAMAGTYLGVATAAPARRALGRGRAHAPADLPRAG